MLKEIASLKLPYQPEYYEGPEFDALCADVAKNGVLVPAVESALGNIIDAYRRILAAKKAGITHIEVVVDASVDSPLKEAAYTFVTEDKRSRRNPVSHLRTLQRVSKETGIHAGKELAELMNVDETLVCRVKKLEKYPPDIIEAVGKNTLNLSQILAIDTLGDLAKKVELLRAALTTPTTAAQLKLLAFPPKPTRGRQPTMATLAVGGCVLSYPPEMSIERFESVLAEMEATVTAKLKEKSKKSFKLADVASIQA